MSKRFNFVATGVGSLPFRDPRDACGLIFQHLAEAPHWPQLPRLNTKEGMIDQLLDGMPGVVEAGDKVYLRPLEPYEEWERFYQSYEEGDLDAFAIGEARAKGFYTFMEEIGRRIPPPFVKGQVTGPITLGLSLKDKEGAAVFFDPDLRDMLVKLVAMKARWQEVTFQSLLPQAETIIVIDEPILSSYGSAFMNVSRDDVISALREAVAPLQGLKGVHICGNTDWPMVMEAGVDIINFDASNYLSSFLLYTEPLRRFLEDGGAVGWGIVPTDEETLNEVESAGLAERLRQGLEQLVREGLPKNLLYQGSLITPSCGAGSLSEDEARKVYQMTQEVAAILRKDLVL